MAALRPIAQQWFRIEVRGIDNIPTEGGALVVSNHSGTIPVDGLMTMVSIHDHTGRHLRALGADLVFKMPIVSTLARKGGATLACNEDAERMLRGGELVGVWPEGFKGIGKPYSQRYKLQRFGRGGFVSAALRTGVPIVPLAVVGAEEIYPLVGNIPALARLLGVPYIPITPLFPLLGPLGLVPLPSKWLLEFGEPIRTDDYEPGAAEDPMLVFDVTDQVRETIQQTLYSLLMQRAVRLQVGPPGGSARPRRSATCGRSGWASGPEDGQEPRPGKHRGAAWRPEPCRCHASGRRDTALTAAGRGPASRRPPPHPLRPTRDAPELAAGGTRRQARRPTGPAPEVEPVGLLGAAAAEEVADGLGGAGEEVAEVEGAEAVDGGLEAAARAAGGDVLVAATAAGQGRLGGRRRRAASSVGSATGACWPPVLGGSWRGGVAGCAGRSGATGVVGGLEELVVEGAEVGGGADGLVERSAAAGRPGTGRGLARRSSSRTRAAWIEGVAGLDRDDALEPLEDLEAVGGEGAQLLDRGLAAGLLVVVEQDVGGLDGLVGEVLEGLRR